MAFQRWTRNKGSIRCGRNSRQEVGARYYEISKRADGYRATVTRIESFNQSGSANMSDPTSEKFPTLREARTWAESSNCCPPSS